MKDNRKLPVVVFRGMQYTMDIPVCRRALVRRQVACDFDSMDGLAKLCDISRSTAVSDQANPARTDQVKTSH